MNIAIYQINLGRDNECRAFQSIDELELFHGSSAIDSSIYDKVWEGEVDCEGLEDVLRKFNLEHPEGYKGGSLSVSDIVEVKGDGSFNFCDSIGFKKVDFDSELAENAGKAKTIRVVLVEPGKPARETEIDATLEGLQRTVGGYIEAMYPFAEETCIVCNEEGKLNGMALNRAVYSEEKEMLDIIAGTFFICDCSGESFGSLSDEQVSRYTELFRYPERFYRDSEGIKAVQIKPKDMEEQR